MSIKPSGSDNPLRDSLLISKSFLAASPPPNTSSTAGPKSDDDEEVDFLDRERAVLGEDAEQFTSGPTVEDDDEDYSENDNDGDLLGDDFADSSPPTANTQGSRPAADDGDDNFESAFPAIDMQNEVRITQFTTHTIHML